jgi:hypothetical protein
MTADEYRAKREWLRLNPHGARAHIVRGELRAYERAQKAQGTDVAALRESKTLTHGYVAYWPNRPAQPLASKVVHADRYCQHIADMDDEYVREATADERERLGRCGTCA